MSKAINITRLVAEFGNYYVNEGQNLQRLRHAIMAPPVTLEKYGKAIRTEETIYRMSNPQFESLIQPFRATFTPQGGITFYPNEIRLPKIKVDLSLTPDEIEDSWIGFMAGLDPAERKNWTITRYVFEEYIKKQIGKDREMQMVYKGVYNPNGNTPSDCMDGIHKKLLDGVQSEYPINIISGLGELDMDTIFDQVESFDQAIDPAYVNEDIVIFVAPEVYRAYMRNYRAKGFYTIGSEAELSSAINFTGGHHILAPLPSMASTKHMWATLKDNLLWIANRNIDTFKVDMQAHHYDVDIILNWREGVGFGCNQLVWATAETVGASASDSASPKDGIVVRDINPVVTGAVAADTTIDVTGFVSGNVPADATVKVAYGTTSSLGSTANATKGDDGNYSAELTSLNRNTKYYLQLQVESGTDVYKSAVIEVTTKTTAPALTSVTVGSIGQTGATVNVAYSDPNTLVTAGGVEYTTDITATPTAKTGTPSAGSMAVALTSLSAETTYYVRAYITVDGEKQYSPWTSFATTAA